MICSVICTSDSREGIILDALKSADFCDLHLIVHMIGPEPHDNTLQVAKDFAGDKYRQVDVPLEQYTDFMGELRNFGIKAAEELGASWALMLDTDERLLLNGFNIERLKDVPEDVQFLTVLHDSGSYDKPRFIRLPAKGRYRGHIHEDWVDGGRLGTIAQARFSEIQKTDEVSREKLLRYLDGMEAQIAKYPDDARWLGYKAGFLSDLGRTEEAIQTYAQTLQIAKDASKAYIYFSMGMLYSKLENHQLALMCAIQGLACNAEMPELHCLAGQASLGLQKPDQAIAWTMSAVTFRHSGRVGFREPVMFFDGPYQIRAYAYKMLGEYDLMNEALDAMAEAQKEKEAYCKLGMPRG